ncbi:hypothetical protein D3C71_1262440 [compost metagenome]
MPVSPASLSLRLALRGSSVGNTVGLSSGGRLFFSERATEGDVDSRSGTIAAAGVPTGVGVSPGAGSLLNALRASSSINCCCGFFILTSRLYSAINVTARCLNSSLPVNSIRPRYCSRATSRAVKIMASFWLAVALAIVSRSPWSTKAGSPENKYFTERPSAAIS